MSRVFTPFILLLAVAVAACTEAPTTPPEHVLAWVEKPQGAVLAQVRAATARYHRVENAIADGYQLLPVGCVPGEGIRYVRFDLYDGVVDPTQPEQLLYQPLPNGKLRLVGVQFIVPAAAWDPFHSEPPHLGNQPFMDRTSPPWGAPFPNYALFVWVWKHNPDGMYTRHNPRVTC